MGSQAEFLADALIIVPGIGLYVEPTISFLAHGAYGAIKIDPFQNEPLPVTG